ncbi:class I SAM-dependent methyltransferase [Microbacter margulisiae]|uniref:Ubiquinone/menaquinone biosynthesis C-methylase UbiE n=1 Tax=Microbacter margulisiae TaxID=1350067 RepID=A0A7W5DQP7_9PORP|nr:class I SAM-dependent methyltransferase [Microbacter margulisiae]MBB3187317.1 ubiquinone/menaquinone biosynthesis C-methylase UbiE [Microbacter margulisiae]
MNTFNQAASTWDNRPVHWERSQAIANLLKQHIALHPDMVALEFGAGTGILSFLLKDNLKKIILMDNTPEMLQVINEKIEETGVQNFATLLCDLEASPYNGESVDLIFTQMAMHHVKDIPLVLQRFYGMLHSKGYIVIADLYPEDGSFHAGGIPAFHNGIDTEQLCQQVQQAQFKNCQHEWCFTVKRLLDNGSVKEFPIFLLIAQK